MDAYSSVKGSKSRNIVLYILMTPASTYAHIYCYSYGGIIFPKPVLHSHI